MDFRPCPRCRKHVPSQASFCRRCGAAMRPGVVAARTGVASQRTVSRQQQPPASRWTSLVAAAGAAVVGGVLAMFAASSLVTPIRDCDRWPATAIPSEPATGLEAANTAGDQSRRDDTQGDFSWQRRHPSVATIRVAPQPPTPAEIISRNAPRSTGPIILDCVAPSAAPGHKVAIRGSRLGAAVRVLFIGLDHGRAAARFRRWDDDRLIAIVPDLGTDPQDAAIAVLTPEGVAVSVARDARSAESSGTRGVRVIASGQKQRDDEGSILFVEPGAAARAASGATLFIRAGGSVFGHDRRDCLLFCEPGVLDRPGTPALDCFEVEAVNPCLVAAPFHYTGR
jgi:hypothetical protein